MAKRNGSWIKQGQGPKTCDYYYCPRCRKIRYDFELEVMGGARRCRVCGSVDLEMPKWVECPHRKTMVKCVTGGAGLSRNKMAYECSDRCKEIAGEAD
jgi:hypothetical protein